MPEKKLPRQLIVKGTSGEGITVEVMPLRPPGAAQWFEGRNQVLLKWEELDTLELERHGWDTLAHAAGFLCSRHTCKPCYGKKR